MAAKKPVPVPHLEFTGERFLPELNGRIALEHWHRYVIAADYIKDKVILDIACGEGYGSNYMAERAKMVYGVDISTETIAHAKAKYARENLQFIQGSCAEIPLPDASIDVAISFETIEHHDRHEEMMIEIRRVLKPNGLLIISSPNKVEHTDNSPALPSEFHVKELSRGQLMSLLKSHFRKAQSIEQRIVYGSLCAHRELSRPFKSYVGKYLDNTTAGLNKPLFFIAVASDAALPRLTNSIFEGEILKDDLVLALRETLEFDANNVRAELTRVQEARLDELATLKSAQDTNAKLDGELQAIKAELTRVQDERAGALAELKAAGYTNDQLDARLQTAEAQRHRISDDCTAMRAALEESQKECNRLLRELSDVQAELRGLRQAGARLILHWAMRFARRTQEYKIFQSLGQGKHEK